MIRWALRGAIDKFERDGDCDASYMRDMIDASPRSAGLFSRVTDLLAAAAVVGGFGLAAPAAANVSVQPAAASVYTMSPGRIRALVAAVVGLIGAVIGGLVVAIADGGLGTGNGLSRGIVAMMVGLVGVAFGGLALVRSRRTA